LFFNKELGRNEVKELQSGAEYFRLYNQKPHQKEYSKIFQLTRRYNSAYQKKIHQTKN